MSRLSKVVVNFFARFISNSGLPCLEGRDTGVTVDSRV